MVALIIKVIVFWVDLVRGSAHRPAYGGGVGWVWIAEGVRRGSVVGRYYRRLIG